MAPVFDKELIMSQSERVDILVLCGEAYLRELVKQGFEVAVVKDATAGARHPELGDGSDILQSPEKRCGRNGEKHFSHSQRALPYRQSTGGKPHLSLVDEGVFNVGAEGAFATDRDEQFFPASWVVPDWDAHPHIFWDLAAGGAGRRRINCHLDRLDDAEAAR
jgi:hypothetical protein